MIETIETTKSKVRDKLYHPSSLDGAGGVIILLHRAGRWVSSSFYTGWKAVSQIPHPSVLGGRAMGRDILLLHWAVFVHWAAGQRERVVGKFLPTLGRRGPQ